MNTFSNQNDANLFNIAFHYVLPKYNNCYASNRGAYNDTCLAFNTQLKYDEKFGAYLRCKECIDKAKKSNRLD